MDSGDQGEGDGMSIIPEERDKRRARLTQLLGGDRVASQTVNALFRRGITTPHELLALTHEEVLGIRLIGAQSALRIGELRGSMRPGFRGPVKMTGSLLNDLYEYFGKRVAADELVSCAMHGQYAGEPPEIMATVQRGERRYTLVLTPTETTHQE